jgi:hypothetical protein
MSYDDWKTTEPDSADPGRLRDEQEREQPVRCEREGCGRVLGIGYVTNPVLGQFCSRACHDAEQDAWDDYMRRRGFQQA